MEIAQPFCRIVWQVLIKLSMYLPYQPAILFIVMYSGAIKTYIYPKTHTYMFIGLCS